jgi:hypothetical protein
VSACHAGLLADNRTPVGSGSVPRSCPRRLTVLGHVFFTSSLALRKEGCMAHTHGEAHAGEEVALHAQLRLPLATHSKRIPCSKSILCLTAHSLPFSSVQGTEVPRSQYGEPSGNDEPLWSGHRSCASPLDSEERWHIVQHCMLPRFPCTWDHLLCEYCAGSLMTRLRRAPLHAQSALAPLPTEQTAHPLRHAIHY